jgi:hypothetical protein
MGGIESGNLYTQEEYDAMPVARRVEEKVVGITPQESQMLQGMNRKQRREWMRANKKFKKDKVMS